MIWDGKPPERREEKHRKRWERNLSSSKTIKRMNGQRMGDQRYCSALLIECILTLRVGLYQEVPGTRAENKQNDRGENIGREQRTFRY